MRQAAGSRKRSANGGHVHILHDDPLRRGRPKVRTIRIEETKPVQADLARFAQQCQEAVDEAALRDLGDSLGLSANSLLRLRVGWDGRRRASTFPMANPAGEVVGIHLRFPNGRKLAVTGGHEGLFVPDGIGFVQPLLLPEGPTDCAALLDLGFDAVGRPSCSGGVRHCVELVRTHWPLNVVVVADRDKPGQHGAEALASALLAVARSVRVIQPPDGIKDTREWMKAGAVRADLAAAIAAPPILRISVKGVKHGC